MLLVVGSPRVNVQSYAHLDALRGVSNFIFKEV